MNTDSNRIQDFDVALRDAFIGAFDDKKFVVQRFFRQWFREQGNAYFFLFKKNLSTTTIQFVELLSLLRIHTKDHCDAQQDLHFVTIRDFEINFNAVVAEVAKSPSKDRHDVIDSLMDYYSPMLRRLVAVELFFGSCTVFIPPHLTL